MEKANAAEAAADRRKAQIAARTTRDLQIKWDTQPGFWKGRDFNAELEFLVSKAASADPEWKKHVALNQWYIQKAIMHGLGALIERIG